MRRNLFAIEKIKIYSIKNPQSSFSAKKKLTSKLFATGRCSCCCWWWSIWWQSALGEWWNLLASVAFYELEQKVTFTTFTSQVNSYLILPLLRQLHCCRMPRVLECTNGCLLELFLTYGYLLPLGGDGSSLDELLPLGLASMTSKIVAIATKARRHFILDCLFGFGKLNDLVGIGTQFISKMCHQSC